MPATVNSCPACTEPMRPESVEPDALVACPSCGTQLVACVAYATVASVVGGGWSPAPRTERRLVRVK